MSHTAVAQHSQHTSALAAHAANRLSGFEGYAVITKAEVAVEGAKIAAQAAKELADQICSLQGPGGTDHVHAQDVDLAKQLASMAAAAAQQAELGCELARSCYKASGQNGGAQHVNLCTKLLADQDAATAPDQGTTDTGSADMTDLQVQHNSIKKYLSLLQQLLEDPAQLQQPDKAHIYSKMQEQGEAAELAWFDQHYNLSARFSKFLHAVCSSKGPFKSYKAGELLPHAGRSWRWLFRPWSAGQAEAAALQHDLQHELAGQRPMPANLKAATAKAHALRQLYVSYKMQSLLAAPSRYAELKTMRFSWKERQAGKAAWRKRRADLKYHLETIRCKEAAAAYLRAPPKARLTHPQTASYTSAQLQPDSSQRLLAKPASGSWQQELAKLALQPSISAYGSHSFSDFASFDRGKSLLSKYDTGGTSSGTQGLQASFRSASVSAIAGRSWSALLTDAESATRSRASSINTSQGSFSSFTTASTSTSGPLSDNKLQVWDLPEEGQCDNSLPCADHPANQVMVPDSTGVYLDQPADSLQLGTSSCPEPVYSSSRHNPAGIAGSSCAKAGDVYAAALDPGLLAGSADLGAIFSLNIDDIMPIDPSDDKLSGRAQGLRAEGITAKAFVAEHSCTADLGPSLPHTVIHVAARLRCQRQSGEEGPPARALEELPLLPGNQAEQDPASRHSSQSQQSTATVLGTPPTPAPPPAAAAAAASQQAQTEPDCTMFPEIMPDSSSGQGWLPPPASLPGQGVASFSRYGQHTAALGMQVQDWQHDMDENMPLGWRSAGTSGPGGGRSQGSSRSQPFYLDRQQARVRQPCPSALSCSALKPHSNCLQ